MLPALFREHEVNTCRRRQPKCQVEANIVENASGVHEMAHRIWEIRVYLVELSRLSLTQYNK